MSTIHSYIAKCSICGKTTKKDILGSCSSFGAPDLDYRPPQMGRGTMKWWTQECPYCGYVNVRLDHTCALSQKEILEIYQEVEAGFDWGLIKNDVALRFAKLGAMHAKLHNYHGAAEQFLRVAWVFDDDQNEMAATHWRKVAIEHVVIMFKQQVTQDAERMVCIYADMLRRVGDFQQVCQLDEYELTEESYIQFIKYQKKLSELGDCTVHTISACKVQRN